MSQRIRYIYKITSVAEHLAGQYKPGAIIVDHSDQGDAHRTWMVSLPDGSDCVVGFIGLRLARACPGCRDAFHIMVHGHQGACGARSLTKLELHALTVVASIDTSDAPAAVPASGARSAS